MNQIWNTLVLRVCIRLYNVIRLEVLSRWGSRGGEGRIEEATVEAEGPSIPPARGKVVYKSKVYAYENTQEQIKKYMRGGSAYFCRSATQGYRKRGHAIQKTYTPRGGIEIIT